MDESQERDLVPYSSDPRAYRWTETAYELLESGALRGAVTEREGIVTAAVEGPCPHCADPLSEAEVRTGVVSDEAADLGVVREAARAPVFVPVTVTCGCNWEHPGAPAGVKGCGVSFRLELLLLRGYA